EKRAVFFLATNHMRGPLGNILKKPTAQTAHLVFADTKANAEKTKRAVFFPTLEKTQSEYPP
ncbi:MAG: hypothetical protein LAT51_12100, partial [Flavobacteriaceae bacterium]|nr:hypothetical protein [Flavobacteriaceae bacterium]